MSFASGRLKTARNARMTSSKHPNGEAGGSALTKGSTCMASHIASLLGAEWRKLVIVESGDLRS